MKIYRELIKQLSQLLLILLLLLLLLLLLPVSVVMAIKRGVLNKYELQRRIQAARSQIERRSKAGQTRPESRLRGELWPGGNVVCSFAQAAAASAAKAAAPLAIATCCCWWCNGALCWSSLTLPAGSQLQMARLDAWLVVLLASWSCRTCCSCQSCQSWMGHRIALPWRTRALLWYLGEFKTKIRMWHTHDRPVPRPALLTAYCCCCSLINYN